MSCQLVRGARLLAWCVGIAAVTWVLPSAHCAAATDVSITGTSNDQPPTTGANFSGGVFDGGSLTSATIFIGSGATDTNLTLLKQLASGAVTIGTASSGAGAGNLTLIASSAIVANSANNLTLTAGNTLTINSTISNSGTGGFTFTGGTGGIALGGNGTSITTATGSQTYNGALVLNNNLGVNSSGGAVNFNGTVDGSFNLAINSSGPVTFAAPVGATNMLARIDTSGTGSLTLNGNVTTSGVLNIGSFLNLGANTVLTTLSSPLSVTGGVNGNGKNLTLSPGGSSLTGGSMDNIGTLAISGTGTATFSGGPITNVGTVDLTGKIASTVTFSGGLSATTLTTGTGAYNLSQTGGTISNGVNYANTGTLALNGVTFTGGATATAPSAISLGGLIKATSSGAGLAFGSVTTGVSLSADTALQATNGGVSLVTVNGNNHALTITNSAASSIAGTVSNVSGLVMNGSGTLLLSGANNFTGATTISSGTLQLGNALALQNSTLNYNPGGTLSFGTLTAATLGGLTGTQNLALTNSAPAAVALTINNTAAGGGNLQYGGVLSGSGSLVKAGDARLELTGVNTYAGSTTINGGQLVVTGSGQLPAATNVLLNATGTSNAELDINPGVNQTIASLAFGGANATGGKSATVWLSNPSNMLTLTGGVTYDATNSPAGAQITNGILAFGTNPAAFNIAASSGSGGIDVMVSSNITGTAGLTKTGGGVLQLAGANDLSGIVNVNTGTLLLNNTNALQNATLNYNNQGGSVHVGTLGSLTLGGLTGTQQIALINDSAAPLTLTIGNNNTTSSYGGVLSGAGNLNKVGTGTFTLTGANTYGGATNVQSGVLADGAAGALSPNSGIFFQSATTALNVNFAETIGGLGGLGNSTGSTVNLASGVGLTIHPSGLTYAGTIAGSTGSLTLSGSGTQALTGTNTYGGGTTIGSGTILQIGASGINSGTTGSIAGNVADGGTLIFARSNDLSFGGVISGTGSLVQNGAGNLTLTGGNTYGGGTTISAGRITVGDGTTAGSITGNVFLNGGTLAFNHSDAVTFAGNTNGNGGFAQLGTGTLTLTGANSFSGTLTIQSGSQLQLGNGGTAGSLFGSTQVNDNGTLIFNRSDNITFNNLITGAGGLVKTGSGTLTLNNNNNSFQGSVAIQQGVLAVTSLDETFVSSALGAPHDSATGVIKIGNGATGATLRYIGQNSAYTDHDIDLAGTTGGATLDVSGLGSVEFAGNVTASGIGAKTLTLTGNNSFGTNTLAGAIPDSATGNATSVLKTGSGTWALSGVNTYTGNTTVNGGTLQAVTSSAFPSGSNIVVDATSGSATLDLDGTTQQVASVTFGGTGNASFSATNNVIIGWGGTLTLGGGITVRSNGTNRPAGAIIAGESPFGSDSDPFSGTLSLGGVTRTFNIAQNNAPGAAADLTIYSYIMSGSDAPTGIIKTGAGSLLLAGASNDINGPVTVSQGSLLVGGNNATGNSKSSGTLSIASGATLAPGFAPANGYSASDVTLSNPVSLASGATLGTNSQQTDQQLFLSGDVTIGTTTTSTVHVAGQSPIFFTGNVTTPVAGSAVTFDGGGLLVLTGSTLGNVTSIAANGATTIFGSASAIPASISADGAGYLGVAYTGFTTSLQGDFLSHVNKASTVGTIGFDTGPDLPMNTFAGPVDLTGFNSAVRLGSASKAILSGPITPVAGNNYKFGNGGGALVVLSNLSAATGVSVNSTTDPLAVVFRGNNTYTGNLDVTNSLAMLDSAHALPAGRTFSLGAGGYVGYTENFTDATSFGSFLSRMTSASSTSVLGIDSSVVLSSLLAGGSSDFTRVVSDPINLSGRSAVYLGTVTNVGLVGPITAPSGGTLYLTGIDHGHLSVGSTLASGNVTSVTVGLPAGAALSGEKNATVEMLAANTYAGGTTLNSGTLKVGATTKLNGSTLVAGPLGLGTLTVPSGGNMPTLAASDFFSGSDSVIALNNAIALNGNLQVGEFQPYMPTVAESGPVAHSSYYYSSPLTLNGVISGSGALDVEDNLTLNGANTFTGGVTLNSGLLTLGNNAALGTGALTVAMPTYNYSQSLSTMAPLTLANRINLNGFLDVNATGALTLNGQVNLNQGSSIWNDGGPLAFNGAITGFGRLTIGGGQAAISGTSNSYSGGTEASYWSTVVFGSAASIPPNPVSNALTSRYGGYLGVASSTFTTSLQADFLNRFDKANTEGAIGFDSASRSAPNTFTGNIDLSSAASGVAFNGSARLGSSTAAILSGTITPQSSMYDFGDGGGTLQVTSNLVDDSSHEVSRSLNVTSFNNPLTLLLTPGGTTPVQNSFSGGTRITNSAVVFSAAGLPPPNSLGRDLYLADQNAYVGLQLTGTGADAANDPAAISGFVSRVSTGTSKGFVGFDSAGLSTQRTISADIDLSGVGSGVYLGTTSNIVVSGNITFSGPSYNFSGYKGGQLTVATALGGTNGVVVGSNTTVAAALDLSNPGSQLSTVILNGSNSYTGGTQLFSGRLVLGNNNALGASSSVLTVNSPYGDGSLTSHPRLEAATFGLLIPNNVVLNDDLTIGGTTMTLGGVISGAGEIYKTDSGTLRLASANPNFSGGIYVQQGILELGTNQSAGTGPVAMGGPLGPVVSFLSSAPSIGTLSGDNVNDQLWLANGATLTINQGSDTGFHGTITGLNGGPTTGGVAIAPAASVAAFSLSSSGSGDRLTLLGASNYSGTTSIASGVTVVASAPSTVISGAITSGPLGTGTVTLNGGKLAVDSGITLYNSLTLNSGSLGGRGIFSPVAAPLIGSGVKLAPGGGGSGPGTLSFATGLTLGAGGAYNWQLQFAGLDSTTGAGHGWDLISVSGALNVSATSANPFVVNLVSLGADGTSGYVSDFNPGSTYTWKIATWTNPLTTFNVASFRIDSTSAFANATGVGQFFLNLDNTGTALQLNFTPVPEPSTWVLLGLGGLVLAFVARRRVGAPRG